MFQTLSCNLKESEGKAIPLREVIKRKVCYALLSLNCPLTLSFFGITLLHFYLPNPSLQFSASLFGLSGMKKKKKKHTEQLNKIQIKYVKCIMVCTEVAEWLYRETTPNSDRN